MWVVMREQEPVTKEFGTYDEAEQAAYDLQVYTGLRYWVMYSHPIEDNRCYATIRESDDMERPRGYVSLNDDLECFEYDTPVVIIEVSTYDRLKEMENTLLELRKVIR